MQINPNDYARLVDQGESLSRQNHILEARIKAISIPLQKCFNLLVGMKQELTEFSKIEDDRAIMLAKIKTRLFDYMTSLWTRTEFDEDLNMIGKFLETYQVETPKE